MPQEILLMGVRWYVAYPFSSRHVEERLEERGVPIDHATIPRWVVQYRPLLEQALHRRKRPVWVSWRMDETYIKIKGEWYYLYRAVDQTGQTMDFLRTNQRDEQAAKRFLTQAIRRHGGPETIPIDGRAAHEAASTSSPAAHGTAIALRTMKSLTNMVEHDQRGVKRGTRPRLGGKSCEAAHAALVGIDLRPMLRQGQREEGVGQSRTAAAPCSVLAASSSHRPGLTHLKASIHENWRQSQRRWLRLDNQRGWCGLLASVGPLGPCVPPRSSGLLS